MTVNKCRVNVRPSRLQLYQVLHSSQGIREHVASHRVDDIYVDEFSQTILVQKFGRDLLLFDVLLKGERGEPKSALVSSLTSSAASMYSVLTSLQHNAQTTTTN